MPFFRRVCSFPPQPLPLGAAGKDQVSFIRSTLGAIVENTVVVPPVVRYGWDSEEAIVAVNRGCSYRPYEPRLRNLLRLLQPFGAVEWGATKG